MLVSEDSEPGLDFLDRFGSVCIVSVFDSYYQDFAIIQVEEYSVV